MSVTSRTPDSETALIAPASPRRRAAALLPQLIVRFTYRASSATDASVYDTVSDAWRWPVPYGYTIELRAEWTLDRLLRPIPRLDAFDHEPQEDPQP